MTRRQLTQHYSVEQMSSGISTSALTEAHPTFSVKRLPVSEDERSRYNHNEDSCQAEKEGLHGLYGVVSEERHDSPQAARKKRFSHKPMTATQQEAEMARIEADLLQLETAQKESAIARMIAVIVNMGSEQQVSAMGRIAAELAQKAVAGGTVMVKSDSGPHSHRPYSLLRQTCYQRDSTHVNSAR